jgi:hypothetical protein
LFLHSLVRAIISMRCEQTLIVTTHRPAVIQSVHMHDQDSILADLHRPQRRQRSSRPADGVYTIIFS